MTNKYFTTALLMLISTTPVIKSSFEYSENVLRNLEPDQEINYIYMPPNNEINLPSEIEEQPRPDSEVFLPASLVQALENLVAPQPSMNQLTPQSDSHSRQSSAYSSPDTPNRVLQQISPIRPNATRQTENARINQRRHRQAVRAPLNLMERFEQATEDDLRPDQDTISHE